jgi:ribosomal protein S5
MDPCIEYGMLIAVAVSFLKKVPFLAKNPKTVAAVLAILSAGIQGFVRGGADFKLIAFCVIGQLSGAIGFHEVVGKRTLDAALKVGEHAEPKFPNV